MKIVLPWPDKRLSPNARIHFRPLADIKKAAREDAALEVAAQLPPEARRSLSGDDGPIPLRVTFYPPDARHRDDDNMVGSFKAARDGLADGLGVNDRRFRCRYYFEDPEKPGRVEVCIG